MDYQNLIYTPEPGGIAWVRIDNPAKMNALAPNMMEGINHYMALADDDPTIRVIVLTGVNNAFCAGSDQSRPIPEASEERATEDGPDHHRQSMSRGQQRTKAIRELKKPTIAMVNGPAVGAGFGMATYTDIRIGCEHARFFAYRGQIPEQGDCWNLPKIVGISRALEILYTTPANAITAQQAAEWGLLNKLVPCEQLEAETRAYCERIIQVPPLQQWIGKKIMWRSFDMSLDATLDWSATAAGISAMSEDRVEARTAFREKRMPVFKGR